MPICSGEGGGGGPAESNIQHQKPAQASEKQHNKNTNVEAEPKASSTVHICCAFCLVFVSGVGASRACSCFLRLCCMCFWNLCVFSCRLHILHASRSSQYYNSKLSALSQDGFVGCEVDEALLADSAFDRVKNSLLLRSLTGEACAVHCSECTSFIVVKSI